MKIFVDADACPVVRITEKIAEKYLIPVMLLCDTNHVLNSDYSEIKIIGAGADAVDFALVNLCRAGDLVITQDFGLAFKKHKTTPWRLLTLCAYSARLRQTSGFFPVSAKPGS